MTVHPAHAVIGANPLSEHALAHVLTDLLDNFAPTDEEEARIALREARYRPQEIAQAMKAWADYWERTTQCSACGQPATAMWGDWNLETGEVTSMLGVNKLSPTCDNCSGRNDGQTVVLAPLGMTDFGPVAPSTSEERLDRHILKDLVAMLDRFDREQAENDRSFQTTTLARDISKPGPLERVKRMTEWIAGLKEEVHPIPPGYQS